MPGPRERLPTQRAIVPSPEVECRSCFRALIDFYESSLLSHVTLWRGATKQGKHFHHHGLPSPPEQP